jgi:hypothetical protein
MNLAFVTNVFPNPVDPLTGLFNQFLVRALKAEHRVSVVTSVLWHEELGTADRFCRCRRQSSRLECQ